MNTILGLLRALALCAALTTAITLPARADSQAQPAPGALVPITDKIDAAWLAKARDAYPLITCVVSGERLHGNGPKAHDFVYRKAGSPDRLIRFCCNSCDEDFLKDPKKYLDAIDKAAAEQAAKR